MVENNSNRKVNLDSKEASMISYLLMNKKIVVALALLFISHVNSTESILEKTLPGLHSACSKPQINQDLQAEILQMAKGSS